MPAQQTSRRRNPPLLSNLNNRFSREHRAPGAAQRAVSRDVDALLLAVGDQGVGLQERVTFDLVGSGNDVGGSDNGLEL